MFMRPLLALLLLAPFAVAESNKPDAPPGQVVAAEHKPALADERVETELSKQATKAHAEFWAIVKDNEKAGLNGYGQKELATNPRAQKQEAAQRKYMSLQHEAIVEFFSIAERRTQMKGDFNSGKQEDKDADAFNKSILTYPWESGARQEPATAGITYARRHGLHWLLALCGGANDH